MSFQLYHFRIWDFDFSTDFQVFFKFRPSRKPFPLPRAPFPLACTVEGTRPTDAVIFSKIFLDIIYCVPHSVYDTRYGTR